MKNHFIFIFILLFFNTEYLISQDDPCLQENENAPFSEQVGLNYLFSDEGGRTKVEGIASRYRQFVLWHNLLVGYIPGTEYEPTSPNTFYPFDPSHTYAPWNYTINFPINTTLQRDIQK